MSEQNKPAIKPGDDEYKVIEKLSQAVNDEDIHWYIQHTFGGYYKKVFNSMEAIYHVWDEGDIPINVIRRKGINKNLLKPLDLEKYDAEHPQPTATTN